MSQKASRRSRRQTNDDDIETASTKSSTPKPNGTNGTPELENLEKIPETPKEVPEQIPEEDVKEVEENPVPELVVTNGHNNSETIELDEMEPLTQEVVPELVIEDDQESRQSEEDELNGTFESCIETASTNAQVGGDSTRLDFTESNIIEHNVFLKTTKDKSFVESLRHLSTRRTIRPIYDSHRQRMTDVVDSFAVGKRKRDEDKDSCKRFKSESPGLFARLSSFRHTFKGDIASSTPKLTGYKDENCEIEENGRKMIEIKEEEKRWCLIM